MKQEEFMESIYGCLERIENKVNSLSISQSWNGNSEADNKDNNKIRQMRKDEENYEEAVRRRAALAKQAY